MLCLAFLVKARPCDKFLAVAMFYVNCEPPEAKLGLGVILVVIYKASLLYLFVSISPVQWIFPEALRISSGLQLAARIRQR